MRSVPDAPPNPNYNCPPDKAKALRQQIDDRLDMLAKAIDDVRATEMFQAYLDVQARFHHYSWHNSLLIVSQCPQARQVAGFQTWKKLGRWVRKGERGIAIFAPCPFKRTEIDDNGNEKERSGVYFKVVYVFDVSQTDGQALPSLEIPDVESLADSLLASLDRVAVNRGIRVNYVEMDDRHYGVSKGGVIDIATGYSTGQQAKTLAHELAHEALHRENRPDGFTRNMAELEAESVAYVVCRHFGLDPEIRASRYIALWGGDSLALRASLERIAETARAIIDDVESANSGKAVA